jgi:DNA topoisomerase-1
MKLLIVESPGKVEKIQKFLGAGFRVMASKGHVRDLPEQELGVRLSDFEPHYVPTDQGRKTLADLAAAVKTAETVYLATDPDREGEGIAWHLAEALKLKNPLRVTFTEITESTVRAAVNAPRSIDRNLVAAQTGRRVLDRLVGYLVSPAVSSVVGKPHLSAGRVQSPALRLVTEREAAITSFKVTSHFGVELTFDALDNISDGWRAQWNAKNWLDEGQEFFQDRETAEKIAALRTLTVTAYQESEAKQAPPSPFTTSGLQQAASNALKINPQRTMDLAQKLYEAGHITYMRTDSPNLSEEAIADIRSLAAQNGWPLPAKPRTWKSKAGAQEAHEAIRATHVEVEIAGETDDEKALYRLIRLRALASQLEEAVYAVTTATLEGELDGKKAVFEAKGRRLTSAGWRMVVDGDQTEEEAEAESTNPIPELREGSQAVAAGGQVLNKKTRPPARFTEAALVKKLEELGIGRPSTYAAILGNITSRGYVKIENRQLVPTSVGESIIAALRGQFDFLDYIFTKELEAQLDDIAGGEADYRNVVAAAHETLCRELHEFAKAAGLLCPDCGKPVWHRVKEGKGGYDFWGCSGRPECQAKFVDANGKPGERMKDPAPLSEHNCPECGKPLRHIEKPATEGKSASNFWGCSGFPGCTAIYEDADGRPGEKVERKSAPSSGFKCPKCRKPLYRRQGVSQKTGKPYDFFACGNRACNATFQVKGDEPDFRPVSKKK